MKDQSESTETAPELGSDALLSGEWYSIADWGEYTIFNGRQDNLTHDRHGSKEAAEAVCRLLARNGFGGERCVFPVRTWTSQSPPDNG